MSNRLFRITARAALGIGALSLCAAALAYTVTQTYNSTTKTYTYRVAIGATETAVKDFHLRPKPGQGKKKDKIKIASGSAPTVTTTTTNPNGSTTSNTAAAGGSWQSPSGGTTSNVSWHTTGSNATGISGPSTANFSVTKHDDATVGEVEYVVTTDGESGWPGGDPHGTAPGPVATVTPSGGDTTPGPGSTQVCALTSTENGQPWAVFLGTSVITDPSPLDPMDIGINTVNPIPPEFGISVDLSEGVFSMAPGPDLSTAECVLNVGAAPIGFEFYLVLVGYDAMGEIELVSEPLEFRVDLD